MEWLEPWCSTESLPEEFADRIAQQLTVEVPSGHVMFGLPVKLIARGNGDDARFEILDGTGRVADVHLTWFKGKERLPYPLTTIYPSLAEWAVTGMVKDHLDWSEDG